MCNLGLLEITESEPCNVLWWLTVSVTQVCTEFNVVRFFIAVK